MSKQFETESLGKSNEIKNEEGTSLNDPFSLVSEHIDKAKNTMSPKELKGEKLLDEESNPELPTHMAEETQYKLIQEIPPLLSEKNLTQALEETNHALNLFNMFAMAYEELKPAENETFKAKMQWTQNLKKLLKKCQDKHENETSHTTSRRHSKI